MGNYVRIHRSYIVAKGCIAKFARTEIVLANSGKVLPVGKKYFEQIPGQAGNDKNAGRE